MKSFIGFVLRFDLDYLSVVIINHKSRGIVDKCTLYRAANLLPRVLFVIELESYDKHDYFVDVYSDVPLFCQTLQIVCATRCFNFQRDCPYTYPKMIFPWDVYIVWRGDEQERRIGKTQPERFPCQVKQGAFTCSEVVFD